MTFESFTVVPCKEPPEFKFTVAALTYETVYKGLNTELPDKFTVAPGPLTVASVTRLVPEAVKVDPVKVGELSTAVKVKVTREPLLAASPPTTESVPAYNFELDNTGLVSR
jgi:hypothetical protein